MITRRVGRERLAEGALAVNGSQPRTLFRGWVLMYRVLRRDCVHSTTTVENLNLS
jgi:hypothetical protein